MTKRTIEIDDTLQERVDGAIEETKDLLLDYLKENDDTVSLPDLYDDLDYSGRFHEIIDSSVPIYTHEIETTWFLYKNELEEAYENAGVGDNALENDGMSAIYFFIYEQVANWYAINASDIFDEWESKKEKATK